MSAQSNPQSAEPRRFAIVVGINQYADTSLLPLQKAQNDADDLARVLERAGGWRSVKRMTSTQFGDPLFPSRDNMIAQVEGLCEILKPDDQVLFFFSGHGLNDSKSGDSYLLGADARINDHARTALNLQKDVLARLEKAGARNVVALVDACQKTVTKDKGLSVVGVDQVKAGGQAVVITATGPGKASYEDPRGPNGLFTRSLLAAFAGDADLDHDGALGVDELARWLPDAVSEYAFSVNMSQKPAVFGAGTTAAAQPPLVRFAASPAAPASSGAASSAASAPATAVAASVKAQFVQFKLPDDVRADIRILDSAGREVRVLSDTAGESPKLEPGSYRVLVQDRLYQYYPVEKNLTVGAAKQTVSLDLKPNFGALSLSVDPGDGVDVLLNVEKRGTTAGSGFALERIKSGTYTLVLNKELYETASRSITIEDGKTNTVRVSLAPNFFSLELAAGAQSAVLYIDGVQKGNLPQSLRLPFRDANLRAVPSDARYKEWTATVSPRTKGSTEKLNATFAGRMGSLEIVTSPDAEADLTLTPLGTSAGPAQKIGTAPLDHETLMGDYELSAAATIGGKKYSGSARVTVREGQTSPVRLDLKDQSPAPAIVQPASGQRESAATGSTNSVGMKLVSIPGGTFTMGSPAGEAERYDNETQHQVTVGGFVMAATEVTQAQWQKVMGTNPSNFKGDSLPVETVSWYDAVNFCNKLSQLEGLSPAYTINGTSVAIKGGANGWRLPTEAEWEYACRAGSVTPFSTGNNVTTSQANYDGNYPYNGNAKGEYRIQTTPVASFAPNAWDLYDMHGNVWEWCWDWYAAYNSGAQTDPAGPASGPSRVERGGSWGDCARILRSAYRDFYEPSSANIGLGIRPVRGN